ncbi:MAG: polysaccharide pyruvyl transferase family protein [Chloroflexota bacterium]
MKILFLGTHGQYNIGDELLLETFLSQLGAEHRYAVNSYDPPFTLEMLRPRFQAETFHTTRELPRFLGHLLTSNLLFFGGGSIIKELYASVGRNPYSTLWMILATVTFAKQLTRKRIVMSNIGVGPIRTPTGERLARMILSQVDVVSVRDQKSLQTCQRLGIRADKLRLVPDAVFANAPGVFLPTPAPKADSVPLKIALNLNYDIENRAAWEPFLDNLSAALTQLGAERPIQVHALPMQSKFKANDDLSVLKQFQARIPDLPFILHDPQSAQEAAQVMAGCDLVLAERLHTLVIASILGKPFFGLVYDVKVKELIASLGMSEHSLDINQPFDTQALADGIRRVARESQTLGARLLERSAALRGELTAYFDELKSRILRP